jgi:hypothetical protein
MTLCQAHAADIARMLRDHGLPADHVVSVMFVTKERAQELSKLSEDEDKLLFVLLPDHEIERAIRSFDGQPEHGWGPSSERTVAIIYPMA